MSEKINAPVTRGTLGLTGLTMNAMALIAPGAFLWLTFQMQSLYGAPVAGAAMWCGILLALVLCLATAVSYAELSKLYPGPGSSYLYAEQAFLSKTHAYKFARIAKFVTGWASHLYYWVYPGVMVGVTAIISSFLMSQFFPDTFSGIYNSPLFMLLFCAVFALGVAYIAYRGVTGTTAVNVAINIIQISALLVFSVIAIGYRVQHPQGSTALHLSNGIAVNYQVAQEVVKDDKGNPAPVLDENNKPTMDKDGKPVYKMQDSADKDGNPVPADKDGKPVTDPKLAAPFTIDYTEGAVTKDDKGVETFNYHKDAKSVVSPHGFNLMFIQACIAILILVGFESVTAMGDEAKHPKKDIPRAVLLSLVIQGAVCYLIEYFAAGYMLNNGYTIPNAGASGAPDRRHDGDRRHMAFRQLRCRQGVYAGTGLYSVSGPDRHDPVMSQHRRACYVCHGPRRRSAVPLWNAARENCLAPSRDLDPGSDIHDPGHHHCDDLSGRHNAGSA